MEEIMQRKIATDWHTHILPGLDDGSRDPEESIAMLRSIAAQGVSAVVLTPHFYPQKESPRHFLERRRLSGDHMERAIASLSDGGESLPERIMGAEVYYFDELWAMDEIHLNALCIGAIRTLLVEMPADRWSHRVFDCLEKLLFQRNIRPMIAHIDRYWKAPGAEDALDALIAEGLLVQMNTGALQGLLGRRRALRWLEAGRIHHLGSDCHNMGTRKPELSYAMAWAEKQLGPNGPSELFGRADG